MKLCAAQTRPVTGDIAQNIDHHLPLIDQAVAHGADLIVFPEMSLTGYEPTQAWKLAISPNDSLIDEFQWLSEKEGITIGVGVPTRHDFRVGISMITFAPGRARQIYTKRYLHPDEEPFFISGLNSSDLTVDRTRVALSICYELFIPQHVEDAYRRGAQVYAASVAKFTNGIDRTRHRLSNIAQTYAMTTMMANCIGTSDGQKCAGKTSAWNQRGELMGQLNDTSEGLLIVDTITQEVVTISL